jgi:hypothetical protein
MDGPAPSLPPALESRAAVYLAEELLPYLQALGNAMPPTFSE